MSKKTKSTVNWLLGSDLGVALVVFNFLIMGWVGMLMNKPFPEGFAVCVGVVFAGKTTHSVWTWQKGQKQDEDGEEQHG